MDAKQLRDLATQCNAAADHLESSHARAAGPVGKFNWMALIQAILAILPTLFQQQQPTPQS